MDTGIDIYHKIQGWIDMKIHRDTGIGVFQDIQLYSDRFNDTHGYMDK